MIKSNVISVEKKDNKIELHKNSFIDKMVLLFNIGGVVIPPLALVGVGLSLINKKYAEENLNILIEHIQNQEIKISEFQKLNKDNIRNFSFNVQKIIEEVTQGRAKEKINIYGNALLYGIDNGSIFADDDNFSEKIDLIANLNINDLRILIKMDKEKQVFGDDTIVHTEFRADLVQTTHFMNGKKENYLGFDDFDIHRMYKLVSLGLVKEEYKSEIDSFRSTGSKTIIKTEIEFKLTEYFDSLKKYIENSKEKFENAPPT